MKFKTITLLGICAALLVTACVPDPTVIPGNSSYDVVISDNRFIPNSWRVSAGKEITLNITNQDARLHDITILLRPAVLPIEDPADIYFQQTLEPGRLTGVHFTAPQAPGEYQVISSQPGDGDTGLSGKLVVVQEQKDQ